MFYFDFPLCDMNCGVGAGFSNAIQFYNILFIADDFTFFQISVKRIASHIERVEQLGGFKAEYEVFSL